MIAQLHVNVYIYICSYTDTYIRTYVCTKLPEIHHSNTNNKPTAIEWIGTYTMMAMVQPSRPVNSNNFKCKIYTLLMHIHA